MKHTEFFIMLLALTFSTVMVAQEKGTEAPELDRDSYYEQRAREDAEYEQALEMRNEEDEKDFWKDQDKYEKDLRKRDKKAYKAYMKGKRDAYAEHAAHCDNHCHHSDHYHRQAQIYYTYHEYHYPRSSTVVQSRVRVATPRVGLSIF
ncbi:hypothetical protein SAMN04487891_105193 [Flagellimonas taeanensis]|jgi:flagellar biosynthesis/type III secretory pathway protein FliH|uniref:Uncharacterized protein n=1 Tax=Flagellimonas taeanensis TaxID=1005926 RepID=A0A1M6YA78_9FLAO|nr:hypothetical protein [Allomuricauda taeanensis]SFC06910.1 hypothetical protein SAMN04487891_105193 [Allomuricauda taeanensis]SHL15063.1 hypothetical protein SAMN05216293_2796 [Allomuricauda taeanensis]